MEPEQEIEKPIKKSNILTVPQAIVFASFIISAAVVFSSFKEASLSREDGVVEEVQETDFIRGDKNAEITIIEYSDFSCPHCGRHHPTLKKILEEYQGKVNWVYRNLPVINVPSAISSQCVGNIGGNEIFWSYADTLMANQDLITYDYMKEQAVQLGVDAEKYDSCVNDPLMTDKIVNDFDTNKYLRGIDTTPYNILVDKNGKMYPFAGALPYPRMKSLIDALLEK